MTESKVLVVDDAPAVIEAFCHALERLGVPREQILTAQTLSAGMALFRKTKPGIVFMDVNVGKEKGDEAALQILESAPSTKVIVVTGVDVTGDRVRDMVSAGAYAVLQKPLRLARIKEVLDLAESEDKGLRRI